MTCPCCCCTGTTPTSGLWCADGQRAVFEAAHATNCARCGIGSAYHGSSPPCTKEKP